MRFGLQKLTLLDFPGMTACTVFTSGCNFRCPFCHNPRLVFGGKDSLDLDLSGILDFLNKRRGVLEGICITGGEPLLRPDIKEFICKVKELGYAVKLDTNGCFPEKLRQLIDDGILDYVAMDVKNCISKYGETVGRENFDTAPIEEIIDLLLGGKVDFEFRTTIVSPLHTVKDIEELARRIKGTKKYFLQNFVDSGDLIGDGMTAHDPAVLDEMLKAAQKYIPEAKLRGV